MGVSAALGEKCAEQQKGDDPEIVAFQNSVVGPKPDKPKT